jgi:hypothetical protein
MKDAYERRALLLHLGSVLRGASHIAVRQRNERDEMPVRNMCAVGELAKTLPWLEHLSPQISAREFVARALEAFRSWPEDLLELPLDHAKLAEPVREHLFADNQQGWQAYTAVLQGEVPWFGEGLSVGTGASPGVDAGDQEVPDDPDRGESQAGEETGNGDVERVGSGRAATRESVEGQEAIYPSWPWKSAV